MGKGSFQPVHPRHIIHFHTNGCSQLLQVKQQMILLYLLYLAGYMLHGPGKNFHFFTRTKLMRGVRCKGKKHSTPKAAIRSFTCFSARGAVYNTFQLVFKGGIIIFFLFRAQI